MTTTKRRVKLMLTCLCDAFFGEVGIAAVRVLEHAGCEVAFPEDQTCCGQPPFNAGAWDAARKIAEHCVRAFDPFGEEPIVTPSGSCAAMLREGYPMLFPEAPHVRCFELGEFLVRELGLERWPGRPVASRKVAFHRACHGRALGLGDVQERLVATVEGIEIMPLSQAEQCCGFGGAFAATHGKISREIGLEKLKHVVEAGVEEIVSGDMGCLMHLSGLIKREGLPIKTRHYVEILSEAVPD